VATLNRGVDLCPNKAFTIVTVIDFNRVIRLPFDAELLVRSWWDGIINARGKRTI
jgi:hypothetical protein